MVRERGSGISFYAGWAARAAPPEFAEGWERGTYPFSPGLLLSAIVAGEGRLTRDLDRHCATASSENPQQLDECPRYRLPRRKPRATVAVPRLREKPLFLAHPIGNYEKGNENQMTDDIVGLIYCPLAEELNAAVSVFGNFEDNTADFGQLAFTVSLGGYKTLITSPNEMGPSTAQAVVRRARQQFRLKFAVCLGICGAISEDVQLGDVCYSGTIIDITENQKVTAKGTDYSPRTYSDELALEKFLAYFDSHPTLLPHYKLWEEQATQRALALLGSTPGSHFRVDELIFRSHRGPIACGPVLATKAVKSRLKIINRKITCIETESAGLYQALDPGDGLPILTVRGVADKADEDKNNLEQRSKRTFRQIASWNAASFVRAQFENNPFLRNAIDANSSIAGRALLATPLNAVADLLGSVGAEIEARLNELSPEYRALQRGYCLPVPRVKELGGRSKDPEVEPIALVASSRKSLVEVPSFYPDKGLPWLFAKKIAGETLNGKVVVPIVIDGQSVRPPNATLKKALAARGYDLASVKEAIVPVFIVTDFPFGSSTRNNFLQAEMEVIEDSISIILQYGPTGDLLIEGAFEGGWRRFVLLNVSFTSISDFLHARFGLKTQEADVIALRLYNTFRQFNLAAHPSYFAGIPREALERFKDANYRVELIDIAVTGFLTFSRNDGASDVLLKQRTRREFLRELAHRDVVKKELMTYSDVLSFIETYSSAHDFDIDAVGFLNEFISNGILHRQGLYVEFSVPFIRSFLLAERLSSDDKAAAEYFDPNKFEVDFETFELYCEIDLSNPVFSDVAKRIKAHVKGFSDAIRSPSPYPAFVNSANQGTYRSSGHILTSGRIKPGLLRGFRRVAGYQAELEKTAEKLLGKNDETAAKQKIIDLASEAREEAQSRKRGERTNGVNKDARVEIGRDWVMGVVMAGAAAEQLRAEQKRELIGDLIALGSLILDDWIRVNTRPDYSQIKREICDRILEEDEGLNRREVRRMASLIVDVVEMHELSGPMSQIMHILCEGARNKVLVKSAINVPTQDNVQALLLALWTLEMDERKGAKMIQDCFRSITQDAFVRVSVAEHLLARAFWFKGAEHGRSALVSAAKDAIKPLKLSVSVADAEIQRVEDNEA